jgi:hypothetical protein
MDEREKDGKERIAHHRHANAAVHLGQSAPQAEENTAHCQWPQGGHWLRREARYSHFHLLSVAGSHNDHVTLAGLHNLEGYTEGWGPRLVDEWAVAPAVELPQSVGEGTLRY